jgi:hypothetical protein
MFKKFVRQEVLLAALFGYLSQRLVGLIRVITGLVDQLEQVRGNVHTIASGHRTHHPILAVGGALMVVTGQLTPIFVFRHRCLRVGYVNRRLFIIQPFQYLLQPQKLLLLATQPLESFILLLL